MKKCMFHEKYSKMVPHGWILKYIHIYAFIYIYIHTHIDMNSSEELYICFPQVSWDWVILLLWTKEIVTKHQSDSF